MTKKTYTFTPSFLIEVDASGEQVTVNTAFDWVDSFNSMINSDGDIHFNTVDDLDVSVINLLDSFIDANGANWQEAFARFSDNLKTILKLQLQNPEEGESE